MDPQGFAAMSLPELSLGTVVLAILAACALFAFLWGMLRLVVGVAVVVASIAAGILTWNQAPGLTSQYRFLNPQPDWLQGALAGAAALITFMVLRRILRFMRQPFGAPQGTARSALFSLLPALLLVGLVFTAVRHLGAGSEVRYFRDAVAGAAGSSPPLMVGLKEAAEKYLPQQLLGATELYNDPARVNLAKLATVMQDPAAVAALQFRAEARPLVTGETAASLRDPRIARLVAERRFADLLRDPVLVSLLEDAEFRKSIEALDLDTILAIRQ